LRIRNWDKFQHYKPMHSKYKKQMTWLKLYGGDILNDIDWFKLSDTSKAIYIELLCLSSQNHGNLPDMETIAFRLRRSEEDLERAIEELSHWIEDGIYSVYTMPIPEEEKEEEEEEEKSKQKKDYLTDTNFQKFWDAYDYKVGIVDAYKVWQKHKCQKDLDKILSHIKHYNDSKDVKDGFKKHPRTYLNQKMYLDPITKSKSKVKYDWEGAK